MDLARLLPRRRRAAERAALARAQTQVSAVVESARDAFVAIDGDGEITEWNRRAEATFGWSRSAVLGLELIDTIVPERHRAAHRAGIERLRAGGDARVLGQRLELHALRRDGSEIPIELTITPVATPRGWAYHAFVRDVSEQRRRREREAIEHAIARALTDPGGPSRLRERVLAGLGGPLGWAAGFWWGVDGDQGVLRCEAAWHADAAATRELERVSREGDVLPASGLPGCAWASRRVHVACPLDEARGPRSLAARAAGMASATALPLVSGGEVVGVLELYARERVDADAELAELLGGLSGRIGEHVARTRAQDDATELACHFALSRELLCTTGADGYLRRLNSRWEEVLGWSPTELRSRPYLAFVHEDDREAAAAATAATDGETTTVDVHVRMRTKQGGWRVISWSGSVSADGLVHASGRDVTDRLAAEQQLRLQAEITRNMAEGVLLVRTSDWRIVYANSTLAATFGYEPGELEGRPVEILTPGPPAGAGGGQAPVQTALAEHGAFSGEVENLRRDGTRFYSSVNITTFEHSEHGQVSVAIHNDITAEKAAGEALAAAEARFRLAFEHAGAGIALIGARDTAAGRFLEVNDALCEITGYSREQLAETGLAQITHPEDLAASARSTRRLLAGEVDSYQHELRLVNARGQVVWVSVSTSLVRDGAGEPLHRIAHLQDISERKRFEGQLQHLADHDPLTGLYNRRRFEEELGRELVTARRYGSGGAVLALDVDNFKYVNDSLGHAAGDELIATVGRLVRDRVRESDVVARLGGDEFAVILPRADEEEARAVAADLAETIRRQAHVMTETGARRVSASIGVSVFHDEPARLTSQEVLVEADIAMYDAKEAGRDRVAVFDAAAGRQARMQAHLTWAERIREALEDDRFVLHAQPIVPLSGSWRNRYELLVRMAADGGELVPPGTFLHVAERSSLILEVDRWVIARAVRLLAEQQRAGIDLCFEVNLSAKSMTDSGLPEFVARELAATGADPRGLVFEITETAAIVNVDRARELAARLHELGCRFALDDFGAGFASFHYLKHLDFDYLKIDGEFVSDLPTSRTNRLVVKALVEMARGLGKATIAECVGDDETLALLREWGVDFAQGFHVGHPEPLEALGLRTPGGRPLRPAVGARPL